jgi:hypothetical protein
MTDTITAPAALSGEWAPDIYTATLALLAHAGTREDQAAHLDTLASIAGTAAAQTYGIGAEDGADDTLAWHETAMLLHQLAAAQRGFVLTAEDYEVRGYTQPWEDLANAITAAEFAAAFSAVSTDLAEERTDDDKPAIREPALRRLCEAAAVCIKGMQAREGR